MDIDTGQKAQSSTGFYHLNHILFFFFLSFVLCNRLTWLPNLVGDYVIVATACSMMGLLLLSVHKTRQTLMETYPGCTRLAIILLLLLSLFAVSMAVINGGPYRASLQFVAKIAFFILLFWFLSNDKKQLRVLVEPYVILCTIIATLGVIATILVNLDIVNYDNWRVSLSEIIGYEFHGRFGFWRFSLPLGLGLFIPLENIQFFGVEYHRLAGYSTEPNVFAIFLEPALFYGFYMYKYEAKSFFYKYSVGIIFICLLCTLSGATLVIFLFLPILYVIRKYNISRAIVVPAAILLFFSLDAGWDLLMDRSYVKGLSNITYISTRLGTAHRQLMIVLDAFAEARLFGDVMRDSGGALFAVFIRDFGLLGLSVFLGVVAICLYCAGILLIRSERIYPFGVAFIVLIIHALKAGFYDTFLSLYVIFLMLAAYRIYRQGPLETVAEDENQELNTAPKMAVRYR